MNLVKFQKLGHYFYIRKIPVVPKILEAFCFIIFNSRVDSKVKIGQGSTFAYLGIGCVIHKDAVIGNNCLLGQGITIGGRGKRDGLPVIGNDVFIGAGARILGPITIGNNVIIGPNSVIIKNVPSNSIVVGIPGRVIKSNISSLDEYL